VNRDFVLPDLGEGLTESELVAWHVAVGDLVELNQPLADVETAKAIVQVPSPFAGVVAELYAEPGTTVAVGAPLVAFDVADDAGPQRNPVLVGYGPPVEGGARPKRKVRGTSASVAEPVEAPSVRTGIRTAPPVRKLAADLGVDLAEVSGTGDDGMITRADVLGATSGAPQTEARDRELRTPIRGVRKATAEAMVQSAFTAPHVTEFLTVDVTPSVELLAGLRESTALAGQRITMLALVAKALCIVVGRTPSVNSRWDDAAGEIVQFGYVNLGIAVATPRGLLVPHLPDADGLRLGDLAAGIAELADTARDGSTTPRSLTGGTISITNVGVFGVDAGTPILNPGEAAILAMGAVRRLPWEHRGEIALRELMTLSLSFDHRLVDGEQGSRFLTDIGAILANPGMVLTMM
jgi:2-oxoisovalerate dehydrogenase E2 component (dihydrolipoyl transacylase)